MTLLDSMKKGTVELLVLSLLSESDMYGYQMVQEIRSRTGGKYLLKEGALYPVLYKLTDAGYLTYRRETQGRRTRLFYHLEPAGAEYAKVIVGDYVDLTNAIMGIVGKKFK